MKYTYSGVICLWRLLKDGLSLKIKILYFVFTQYLWKYALVEDIDNWTRSHILYWQKKDF